MNIQQAKDEIKRSVSIYLMKDEYGNYRIPIEKQRPVFMQGAPGIGKTAIMAQIAQELDIGLVAYSMTHHTRQSALGLPFIEKRTYDGKTFDVSVYTLSEILASVYESMEKSGKKEGILFLDEINCVSETLGPSMLQFLQYKTFGNHKLPEGWIVVTAGNPAEFNRAVHEFDVATLDRLKVLKVEADFNVWKTYAAKNQVHEAILTYLEIHRQDFYEIETTLTGKNFVTGRGWEDLSEAIVLYEEKGYKVDSLMISQYIHNERIVEDFATYYDLFCKYRSDYKIRDILAGEVDDEIKERAKEAGFDERLSVVNLLLEGIVPRIVSNMEKEDGLKMLLPTLKQLKLDASDDAFDVSKQLEEEITSIHNRMLREKAGSGLSSRHQHIFSYCMNFYHNGIRDMEMQQKHTGNDAFTIIKKAFDQEVSKLKQEAKQLGLELHEAFKFVEENFDSSYEVILLVTQLTVNTSCARFIAEYGCEDYYRNNDTLMVQKRNERLMEALEQYAKKQEDLKL